MIPLMLSAGQRDGKKAIYRTIRKAEPPSRSFYKPSWQLSGTIISLPPCPARSLWS